MTGFSQKRTTVPTGERNVQVKVSKCWREIPQCRVMRARKKVKIRCMVSIPLRVTPLLPSGIHSSGVSPGILLMRDKNVHGVGDGAPGVWVNEVKGRVQEHGEKRKEVVEHGCVAIAERKRETPKRRLIDIEKCIGNVSHKPKG